MKVMLCRLGVGRQRNPRATVAGLETRGGAHEPRNAGSLQKLAREGLDSPPEPPARAAALPTPGS